MIKYYFCNTIGDGTQENPYTPAISKYTADFIGTDARVNATAHGRMMVDCRKMTELMHTNAITDTDNGIVYFDVEDIGLDDKIGLIKDRTKLKENLNAEGLTIDGLTSESTLRDVLISIVTQLMIIQNPNVKNIKTHYDN